MKDMISPGWMHISGLEKHMYTLLTFPATQKYISNHPSCHNVAVGCDEHKNVILVGTDHRELNVVLEKMRKGQLPSGWFVVLKKKIQ